MGRLMAAANGLSFVTFAAADAVALVLRVLDSGEPVCLSPSNGRPRGSPLPGFRLVVPSLGCGGGGTRVSGTGTDLDCPFAADAPVRSLAAYARAEQTLAPETMLGVRDARVIFANYGAILADFAPMLGPMAADGDRGRRPPSH